MRATWDAAAASDRVDEFVGDPATARAELEGLFGRLGADPRGGTLRRGRLRPRAHDRRLGRALRPGRRRRRLGRHARACTLGGERGKRRLPPRRRRPARYGRRRRSPARSSATSCFSTCPSGESSCATSRSSRACSRPAGSAFVQLPVMDDGLRARLWRVARGRGRSRGRASSGAAWRRDAAYRGTRLTEAELQAGLARAGLRPAARDESPESPYRYAREVFLRLERAA